MKLRAPTQRALRTFFSQKRSWFGLTVFWSFLLASMTAEPWSHQNPIIFRRELSDGSMKTYFTSLVKYSAQEFEITDSFVVDYAEVLRADQAANKKSWAWFAVNRWDPYIQTAGLLQGPSPDHWLGTDNLGRDVTARLLYGLRVSLAYGLLFWLISYAVGVVVGLTQGYFAGRVDFLTERVKELAEIIPFLSVVILINGLTQSQSFWVTLFVVVIFGWIGISSQMRAQVLALRKREFCQAAIAMGGSHTRVVFKHILPNAITPILTLTPFAISAGISTLAVLDYLGFGLNPPTPSLGELLQQGRNAITTAPWVLMAPTITLALLLIAINLLGESLREAFDPKK